MGRWDEPIDPNVLHRTLERLFPNRASEEYLNASRKILDDLESDPLDEVDYLFLGDRSEDIDPHEVAITRYLVKVRSNRGKEKPDARARREQPRAD